MNAMLLKYFLPQKYSTCNHLGSRTVAALQRSRAILPQEDGIAPGMHTGQETTRSQQELATAQIVVSCHMPTHPWSNR